jgi:hypothetical protein
VAAAAVALGAHAQQDRVLVAIDPHLSTTCNWPDVSPFFQRLRRERLQ